ncbi:HNH endonuclease [Vibrio anguillarum]|uniref:Putative HNH nuclease YajD n=7 Tax=Vibrio anguillarum TaxID=55601 RepID=A0AAW4AZL0_VIBAN|nr:HNH endonuclease [Vibrio anguillarum]AOT26252.1 holin [Vibrio phage Her]AOT26343.1 holin [Vibrio phage Cla]AOT26525.1 holin [Vibrio phage Pel]AOT26616.1 holin [Vibrio phage pVa-2]AOT26707.1 holin [Vibrio phage pVa-1]AOT26798.1 holin [Vibrio phage vB_VspP_pVa5_12Jun]AOT26889.1 holin [Vibrio phage pVa-6]AOT26983.1 holin [Vibrio phage VaK]AOT27076.1 holin [Vibrio phage Strym]AOT27169.1 holin [Vibrio phage pVa-7]ARB12882.1 holin [Vibrio phage H2 PGK-2017]ARB12957.1 holin [Vibrio phage H8
MPRRVQKICRLKSCNALTRNKNGYCDSHAEHATGWVRTQAKKGSSSQRGYGYAWRIKRARILERDSFLCQVCLSNGIITAARDVDHIINKANGGTDDDANLQSICSPCHKEKTAKESRR